MMDAPEWKKRLEHQRAIRDAYVAMGNPAPDRPDPEGGLIMVPFRRFNGKVFRAFLAKRGHDNSEFEACACRTRYMPESPRL